eukprot:Sspe_Gene.92572::Locus_65065_Transcript_1_6_Confidence_0.588_Length_818::g.92572::m.92572
MSLGGRCTASIRDFPPHHNGTRWSSRYPFRSRCSHQTSQMSVAGGEGSAGDVVPVLPLQGRTPRSVFVMSGGGSKVMCCDFPPVLVPTPSPEPSPLPVTPAPTLMPTPGPTRPSGDSKCDNDDDYCFFPAWKIIVFVGVVLVVVVWSATVVVMWRRKMRQDTETGEMSPRNADKS